MSSFIRERIALEKIAEAKKTLYTISAQAITTIKKSGEDIIAAGWNLRMMMSNVRFYLLNSHFQENDKEIVLSEKVMKKKLFHQVTEVEPSKVRTRYRENKPLEYFAYAEDIKNVVTKEVTVGELFTEIGVKLIKRKIDPSINRLKLKIMKMTRAACDKILQQEKYAIIRKGISPCNENDEKYKELLENYLLGDVHFAILYDYNLLKMKASDNPIGDIQELCKEVNKVIWEENEYFWFEYYERINNVGWLTSKYAPPK